MRIGVLSKRKNYDERILALEHQPVDEAQKFMKILLWRKYKAWRYEKEVRAYISLEERDQGTSFYFKEFDDDLKLREVITGPLCTEKEETFMQKIGNYPETVEVSKARVSYNSFEMEKDEPIRHRIGSRANGI